MKKRTIKFTHIWRYHHRTNSSDVAKNIEEGKVGGLFNIKSVERLKKYKGSLLKKSRLIRDGRDSWLKLLFPFLRSFFYLGYEID
jgi:hypothetical protein